MYDASSRKDVRRAEKAARLFNQQRAEVLTGIMSVPNGRAWVFDLLEACHIFSDPFTGDALLEAHNKGERNIGLRLLAEIMQHCPDNFILAMREANERNTAAERSRGKDTDWRDQGSDSAAGGEDLGGEAGD